MIVYSQPDVVSWEGDGDYLESEADAAFRVVPGVDEGRALDELELQLRSAGVGATRGVGARKTLEDEASKPVFPV